MRIALTVCTVFVVGLMVCTATAEDDWFDMENCAICKHMAEHQHMMMDIKWEAKPITKGMLMVAVVPEKHQATMKEAHKNMMKTIARLKQGEEMEENPVVNIEYIGTTEDVVRVGLATESPFELAVIHNLSKRGLIRVKVLDVPVLDSEGWRNLSDELKIEILERP